MKRGKCMCSSVRRVLAAVALVAVALPGVMLLPASLSSVSLWHYETADSTAQIRYLGDATSLALDASGNPHISYGGTNQILEYAWKDAGGWHTETADGEGDTGQYASLALDASGNPHVSHYNYNSGALEYAWKDAGGWHNETIDSEGVVGWYTSLALDASGYPRISYFDYTNGHPKYAWKDAGGWHNETFDSAGSVGWYTSLALDASGNPCISYYDSDLKYAWKDTGGWHTETADGEGNTGEHTSLALDASGNPRISYREITNQDLKYAWKDTGGWHTETVDGEGDVGHDTSLALDAFGNPRISYHDATNSDLKYAWKDAGGAWQKVALDSVGDAGYNTSLALDASGNPHISYGDGTNNSLECAWMTTDPKVATAAITGITHISASSGGNVTIDGSEAVTARGVCWNTTGSPTTADLHTADGTGTGAFASSMTGLGAATTYYVRAYATNAVGTSYGEELLFATDTTPGVVASAITAITHGSATSGGNVISDGGDTVTARGVCWNTMGSPTTADLHTADGTGTGAFASSMTGLGAATTYYVRAYATNTVGTSYGEELTFTTGAATPTVSTVPATDITMNSAFSGGNVTSDGGSAVTSRGVCWNTTGNPTTADPHAAGGTGTGAFASVLTGLSPATTYYLRAYATNAVGTSYGNEASFTTGPDPSSIWYLAEGSTGWGFEAYISVANPNPEAVNVTLTYMTSSGAVDGPTVAMPPMSQATVFPSQTLGAADFSTQVECTEGKAISVDRTMYWTGPTSSIPEAHCATGVTAPEPTWYMPEGSSAWGFECFLLIQNPNTTPTDAVITWMIEGATPVTTPVTIAASSRATYNMADFIGAADASIKVDAESPVICERAMYRNDRREGHDSGGTPTAAADYYLAEGCAGFGFTTWVLVQNPNDTETDVTVTYQVAAGPVEGPTFTMPPQSRRSINVNETTAIPGDDPSFSTHVHGSQPIIAERAMYWNGERTQPRSATTPSAFPPPTTPGAWPTARPRKEGRPSPWSPTPTTSRWR